MTQSPHQQREDEPEPPYYKDDAGRIHFTKVATNTNWEDEAEKLIHEWAIHPIPENILAIDLKSFIKGLLTTAKEEERERCLAEVKRIADLYKKAQFGLDDEILNHLISALTPNNRE